MKELLPELKDYVRAYEQAAQDLYGFAMICNKGVSWVAEQEILDLFLLASEKHWFTDDHRGQFNHREFRIEFFQGIWALAKKPSLSENGVLTPGQKEMSFFRLPLFARAAVFLRTKRKFTYQEIAEILGSSEGAVKQEIEKAREVLLGRGLAPVRFLEDV